MGTVWILGAGFSRTCGIATDMQMLDALNPLLPRDATKDGSKRTSIEHMREQLFAHLPRVGFENFMSSLSAAKFLWDYMQPGKNVFRQEERELQKALRLYLRSRVGAVDWTDRNGKVILEFARRVNWKTDYVLTFNYDLLLEAAASHLKIAIGDRIIHLHGAIGEDVLAWPTYTKFAYRTTRVPMSSRWKRAFHILRNQAEIDHLVFIGYSMPPADLEARALFNYADWYNQIPGAIPFYEGKRVPPSKHYKYDIVVVNPSQTVKRHFAFFRKGIAFRKQTLRGWLRSTRKPRRKKRTSPALR